MFKIIEKYNDNENNQETKVFNYEDDLKKNYISPGHPIAFSGITNIYNFYKGKISYEKIKEILSGIENYTLHKEFKRGQRNPSYSHFKRNQWQMDLIDIQELSHANDNVRYLLSVIDTFTRFAWVRLLKDKRGETVLEALKSIILVAGKPKSITCDRGTEFQNTNFKIFCTTNDIFLYTPDSSIHAAYIERFNRTFQSLLYKYMTENETHRFIDRINPDGSLTNIFSQLLHTYNNRKHRMIGTTPTNAENNPNSHLSIRLKLSEYYEKIKPKKRVFNIGDTVRISKIKGKFARGYKEQSNQEIFKIFEIKEKSKIPMYILETYNGTEKIKGAFYDFELTKVKDGVFRIEKILKTRKKGNIIQHFVKWKGFDDSYNSWIISTDVEQKF